MYTDLHNRVPCGTLVGEGIAQAAAIFNHLERGPGVTVESGDLTG
jgi:hypothetical protein